MGITERKEREKAQMRARILKAAREIIISEGTENISVRKIAKKIEYSPAIIYHYFSSMEEIIEKLIEENYAEFVQELSALQEEDGAPEEKLRSSMIRYITQALEMGDYYKSMMLNDSPSILAHTAVLQNGAARQRTAVGMLCGYLKELPYLTGCGDSEIEMTAQIIWSTAFGLATRLIVEQVEEEQKQRLIQYAAEFILHALKTKL